MSKFEIEKARTQLAGDCGFRFYLASDFARSRKLGGLASSAHAFLDTAIECQIAGYCDPATALLTKARHWLDVAIQEKERPNFYFENGTEALWHRDLAICNWLLDSRHDAANLARFVEYQDRYLRSQRRPDPVGIGMALSGYVDAGAYDRVFQLFAETRRLTRPTDLAKVRGEAQFAYVVCQYRTGQVTAESLISCANSFFRRTMGQRMSNGHFDTVAYWMKIIHWQNGTPGLTADEALCKCMAYV